MKRLAAALPLLLILLFVAHRLAVVLSAGDHLYPLDASEAKHTQIAWDLLSGRFGTHRFEISSYVTNSGSVHHGSYSTAALAFLAVSKVAGFSMLAVRLTALLFWAAGLGLLAWVLQRLFGPVEAALGVLGCTLVPSAFMAIQVTFLGSHSESVLPLAALLAAWLTWLAAPDAPGRSALLGACAGYCVAFTYLLVPVVGMVGALSLLPPRPRPGGRALVAGFGGALLGLWPVWLILALEPAALFTNTVTEQTTSSPLNLLLGGEQGYGLVLETLQRNLPSGASEYWAHSARAPALFGGEHYEWWSWRATLLAPLLLAPLAATSADPRARRLGLLVAVGPALLTLAWAMTTPFKPHLPPRYLVAPMVLAWLAPAVAIGLGRARGGRMGWTVAALAGGFLLWNGAPRVAEGLGVLDLAKAAANREHRLVTYYNLGVGTVWADEVRAVNDLVDVRCAARDPKAFSGVQAALWGKNTGGALGLVDDAPAPVDWSTLRASMGEAAERQSYLTAEERDDPTVAAENIGWGLGIRSDWDPAVVARVLDDAGGDWPPELARGAVWEGFGLGWGRRVELPAAADVLPPSIPEEHRADVARGMERGRAVGVVPVCPIPPPFPSVRGAAT